MVIAHVLSPKMAGIGGEGCDINSSFLAKFRFPPREYMRICNAVENIHIHKVIGGETELSSSQRLRQLFESAASLSDHKSK